jgi:hypothetical protein
VQVNAQNSISHPPVFQPLTEMFHPRNMMNHS